MVSPSLKGQNTTCCVYYIIKRKGMSIPKIKAVIFRGKIQRTWQTALHKIRGRIPFRSPMPGNQAESKTSAGRCSFPRAGVGKDGKEIDSYLRCLPLNSFLVKLVSKKIERERSHRNKEREKESPGQKEKSLALTVGGCRGTKRIGLPCRSFHSTLHASGRVEGRSWQKKADFPARRKTCDTLFYSLLLQYTTKTFNLQDIFYSLIIQYNRPHKEHSYPS